jgi:hypothetical protein
MQPQPLLHPYIPPPFFPLPLSPALSPSLIPSMEGDGICNLKVLDDNSFIKLDKIIMIDG